MASAKTVSGLYDQLQAQERLALVLEAMARGDQVEAGKLRASCPRKMYMMSDAAFMERLEMAFDVMAIVCIDLRCCWAELNTFHRLIDSLDELDQPYRAAAGMAFLQGVRYGRGEPPFTVTRDSEDGQTRPQEDPEAAESDPVPDSAGADGPGTIDGVEPTDELPGDEECEDEDGDVADNNESDTLGKRLDEASALAGHASDGLRKRMIRSAESVAQIFLEVFEALERFCRRHMGIGALTLLKAWSFHVIADFPKVQGRYPDIVPREAKVNEYIACLEGTWTRQFEVE